MDSFNGIIPTVTADVLDPDMAAFVMPGNGEDRPDRVYYDLHALVRQYVHALVPRKLAALAAGDREEDLRIQGAGQVLNALIQSQMTMVEQYQAGIAMGGVTNIGDMFPGLPE